MITIYQLCVNHHFFAFSNLPQQLSATVTCFTSQHLVPVFSRPHYVVLAVPNRMTTFLIVLHLGSINQTPLSVA